MSPSPIYAIVSMSLLLCGSHTCNTDSWLHSVTSRRPHFTALLLILQLLPCVHPSSTALPGIWTGWYQCPGSDLELNKYLFSELWSVIHLCNNHHPLFETEEVSLMKPAGCGSKWISIKQEEGSVENTSGRSSQGAIAAFRRQSIYLPFSASMTPKTALITPCQVSAVFCMCLGLSRDVRSKTSRFCVRCSLTFRL